VIAVLYVAQVLGMVAGALGLFALFDGLTR
jgi:hypothetical protein